MDNQNVANLNAIAPDEASRKKIHLAYEIIPAKATTEIADPWYTERFDITFNQLNETLPLWFEHIKNKLYTTTNGI